MTPQALHVLNRDESQGILLGTVKTSNDWVNEIVDGDKSTNGRTTGNVDTNLSALSIRSTVYIVYNFILKVNERNQPTETEFRLAARNSNYPEEWDYELIDTIIGIYARLKHSTALVRKSNSVLVGW